jgi:putative transposase
VLDMLVQSRRNTRAAKRVFRKLPKGLTDMPRVIITDQLKSYGAAKQEILPGVEHRRHRSLNNRAEHSHQPTRQRERRDAAVQVGRARRALSGGLWAHRLTRPLAPPPILGPGLPRRDGAPLPGPAGRHNGGSCRIHINQGAAVYLQAYSWHGST